MSVAVENVRDVSSMGQQAQDVYSSAPEAFKADIHLAFRSDRVLRLATAAQFTCSTTVSCPKRRAMCDFSGRERAPHHLSEAVQTV